MRDGGSPTVIPAARQRRVAARVTAIVKHCNAHGEDAAPKGEPVYTNIIPFQDTPVNGTVSLASGICKKLSTRSSLKILAC